MDGTRLLALVVLRSPQLSSSTSTYLLYNRTGEIVEDGEEIEVTISG